MTLFLNPHFSINTLTLMRGAVGMQWRRPAEFERHAATIYRAMREAPHHCGAPVVLVQVLREAGFDPAEFEALVADAGVKAALVVNAEDAVARGVCGAPMTLVGEPMYFGQDRLDFVREALA